MYVTTDLKCFTGESHEAVLPKSFDSYLVRYPDATSEHGASIGYAAQEAPSKVVNDHVQRNEVEQLCKTLAQKE
jgi:hypothetical protein